MGISLIDGCIGGICICSELTASGVLGRMLTVDLLEEGRHSEGCVRCCCN